MTDHSREIAFLTWVSTGVLALMGFGLYNATKAGIAFDPAAYLVVITLVIGVIKEGRLSRSVDRMGQSLAAAPAVNDNAPAPADAKAAAQQTADAAQDEAAAIAGEGAR